MDTCASTEATRVTQAKSDTGWTGRNWTPEELDRLEQYADSKVTTVALAEAFPNRTPRAIRTRLCVLRGTAGNKRQCQRTRDDRMATIDALGDQSERQWRNKAIRANEAFLSALARAGYQVAA